MKSDLIPSREDLRENQDKELVLIANPERWVLLPVEFPTIMEFYKKLETSFWTPEDFKWKQDIELNYFNDVSPALIAAALDYNLMLGVPAGVIGASDTINGFLYPDITDLTCELTEAIQSPEARAFLGFQSSFENFSREVLTRWLDVLMVPSPSSERLHAMFLEEQVRPSLVAKQKWLAEHLEGFHLEGKTKRLVGDTDDLIETICNGSDDPAPMAEVLIAFAVQKSIFFAGLSLLDLLFPELKESALSMSAQRMYADFNLHSDFVLHLYSSFEKKLDLKCLTSILVSAIELEFDYLHDVFHTQMDEDNQAQVAGYLRSLLRRCLHMIYPEEYEDLNLPEDRLPICEMAVKTACLPIPRLEHKGAFHIKAGQEQKQQSELQADRTTTAAAFAIDEDF